VNWLFSIGLHNAAVVMFLTLLVWGITRIWKNAPAAHLLWLLVLVKLVTPPLVNLNVEIWGSGTVESVPSSAVSQPIIESSQVPIPLPPEIAPSDHVVVSIPRENPNSIASDGSGDPQFEQPGLTVGVIWNTIRPVLMWLWLGGAGLVALLAGIRIFQFQRMLGGTLPASQRLQSVADQLATRMGLRQSPAVRLVDSATAPFVWCFGWRATVTTAATFRPRPHRPFSKTISWRAASH
jgi:bla regulator protein BlaR1